MENRLLTPNDLRKAAAFKGWAIEEREDEYGQITHIGLQMWPHVWSWFCVAGHAFNDEARLWVSFDHTYSQNTGKTKKGIWEGIKKEGGVKKALEAAMEAGFEVGMIREADIEFESLGYGEKVVYVKGEKIGIARRDHTEYWALYRAGNCVYGLGERSNELAKRIAIEESRRKLFNI